jgi:putative (di)nucleoside polyphosphate hydrolase
VTQHRRARRPLAKARRKAKSNDPNFVMLLADPEIRLLMHADNVDEGALLHMLKDISVQLRNTSGRPKDHGGGRQRIRNADPGKYRRGVGIMLINTRTEIFIARRNDVPGEAWQMPQGGIDRGETPEQAAFRELKEEIGTDNAEIVAESKHWLYYDLPENLAKNAWGGRWRGQRQKWFVMLFRGDDSEINLATKHPEFDAWRWVPVYELESLAVTFKRQLYASLLREFAATFRD